MLKFLQTIPKIEDVKTSSNNTGIDVHELAKALMGEIVNNNDLIKILAHELALATKADSVEQLPKTIDIREAKQILQLSKRRITQLRKRYPEITSDGNGARGYNREAVERLAKNRRMKYIQD